jgi:hypothetical protein
VETLSWYSYSTCHSQQKWAQALFSRFRACEREAKIRTRKRKKKEREKKSKSA